MFEPDPLHTRFAAFRQASIARTAPPGTAAVRRTVARRRAGRITAVSTVIVTALTGTVLWSMRPAQLPHPESASSSPSAVVSAAPSTATAAERPTPSTASAPSASLQGTPTVQPQTASICSTVTPGQVPLSVNDSDPLSVSPGDYFSRCPKARIRVYAARYQWDANRQEYTLAHLDNAYLTATSPTAPKPTVNPASLPGCGYAFIIAQSNVDPPGVFPPSLESAPLTVHSYWSQHNLGYVVEALTNVYTPAEQAGVVGCQPPGGSSASPTP